jgi:GH24 family phage-related lysozyme (muramidase)
LISFVFNVGCGAFRGSTMLKLLNAGQIDSAAGQFKRWNKADGKVVTGLTRRRHAEEKLFRGEL